MTIELTDGIITEITSKLSDVFNLWSYDFGECSELWQLEKSLEEGKTEIEIDDDLSGQDSDLIVELMSIAYDECVLYNTPDIEIHFKFTVDEDSLIVDANLALGRMGGSIDQVDPIVVLNGEVIFDLDEELSYEYDESEIEIEKEKLISRLKEASDVDLTSIKTSFEVILQLVKQTIRYNDCLSFSLKKFTFSFTKIEMYDIMVLSNKDKRRKHMPTKEELLQQLELFQTQIEEASAQIETVESKLKEIEKEEKIAFNTEVRRIVERMNEHFNSDDRSFNIRVRAFDEQQLIIILHPESRVALLRFLYGDSSLEEIEAWADKQIASLQFYRLLVGSFDIGELYDPIFGDRFAIKAFDDVSVYPTYDPDSGLVTLEIRSFLSLNSINKILNELTGSEITFNNLSNVDEDDHIVEAVESYTCRLDQMIDEIKAICKEYNM